MPKPGAPSTWRTATTNRFVDGSKNARGSLRNGRFSSSGSQPFGAGAGTLKNFPRSIGLPFALPFFASKTSRAVFTTWTTYFSLAAIAWSGG